MTNTGGTPAGWYHAPGDAEGTNRYWDGSQWIGEPQAIQQQSAPVSGFDPDATVQYNPPPAQSSPPSYGAPSSPPPGFDAPGTQSPPSYAAPQPGFGAGQPSYGAPGGPQFGQPAAPPPGYVPFGVQAGSARPLGEWWQRVVARIVDGLIWGLFSIVFGIVFGAGALLTGGDDATSFGLILVATVLATVGAVAYEVLMTTKTGSTLGKKIFGLKIVQEDGSTPDAKTMLMRMSTYIAASVLGVIPILGILASLANFLIVVVSFIFLFTDARRQTIWDKIAKTTVVV
jgi:uncharacterized RDD family membrane protein YckC